MPRGHKESPQDSIESILLAISRRNDIDPDTLSHYLDRLDEEWTAGARDKVMHLLGTSDTTAQAAAVLILSELATDFDLGELERFIADPGVSDLAKLSLAPVLHELGSTIADEGIIDYLSNPESAMHQVQIRLLELVGESEMGLESVLEDVLSMPVGHRLGFINWLGHSSDLRAAHLLLPLLENQSGKVAIAVIDALECLGNIASQYTIPALHYLIAHSSNRVLKQRARVALGRLTMQSVPGIEDTFPTQHLRQDLVLYEARVSYIDGSGAQMVMLSWHHPDGFLKGVNVLCHDQWGIKDCYSTDEMSMARWSELVGEMEEQGFGSFQVPFEYICSLIAEARALNKRTHQKLPIAYAIWRPIFEENTSHKKQKNPSTMIDPCNLDASTMPLVQRGDELYQMPEFMSWLFEPLENIQPYINRYWSGRTLLSGQNTGRERRKSQKQQELALDTIVDEALQALVDNKWRTLYESRLRRQGTLFQCAGRLDCVELIRAVAAALHPNSSLQVQEQPFLQAMMRLSIQQGPLRMMTEVLESSTLTPTSHRSLPPEIRF